MCQANLRGAFVLSLGAAMRKRSRAGGQPAKAQRRKTAARKSHITPKALHPRSSSAARKETKVARLTRERDEALAQRTATSELLKRHQPLQVRPASDPARRARQRSASLPR